MAVCAVSSSTIWYLWHNSFEFVDRQREEMLCQLKVTMSPAASEVPNDSPWILVDSDGEEVNLLSVILATLQLEEFNKDWEYFVFY